MEPIKAFYFSTKERKLRYGDNREIVVGDTHSVSGDVLVCHNGLHASKRLIDAMNYAPGENLFLVEMSGDMDHDKDKLAARNRKYLAEFDATELLKAFVRKQALDHIHVLYSKDVEIPEQYRDAIVKFLETGDEEYRIKCERANPQSVKHVIECQYFFNCLNNVACKNFTATHAYYATRSSCWFSEYLERKRLGLTHRLQSLEVSERFLDERNDMLVDMIREATGWDV